MTHEEYIKKLNDMIKRIDNLDLTKSPLSIEEKTDLINKLDDKTTQLEKLTFND